MFVTLDKSKIMKFAWQIARKGAKDFGGKAVDYFAEALRKAWSQKKATIAKQQAEIKASHEALLKSRRTNKSMISDRDVTDLEVTFKGISGQRDSFGGFYAEYIFTDVEGNYYFWTTKMNGFTAQKLVENNNYKISFNKVANDKINYVTVK